MYKCGLEISVKGEGRLTIQLNIAVCFLIKQNVTETVM